MGRSDPFASRSIVDRSGQIRSRADANSCSIATPAVGAVDGVWT